MNKDVSGQHDWPTKKSEMTKVKARQHVNYMSNLIQHKLSRIGYGMVHMAAHSM